MTRYPTTIIVVVLALITLLAATAVDAAEATAKAGLKDAIAEAQKWQKDAVLVNVSTLQANSDGTAAKWGYMYYSAKAKKGYTVDVKDGKVVDTLEVNPYIKDAVSAEFVDSDKAMAEAKKNGLKIKGKAAMSLLVMGQATKYPCTCWSVVGGYEKGDVGVLIDAKTGKFSSKSVMP
jgi:nucleoside 2-deoxyribosyltransferase